MSPVAYHDGCYTGRIYASPTIPHIFKDFSLCLKIKEHYAIRNKTPNLY